MFARAVVHCLRLAALLVAASVVRLADAPNDAGAIATQPPPEIQYEAIATDGSHTCAIRGGGAYCWGSNEFGQVGDSTLNNRRVPVPVRGAASGVTRIDAGGQHTCAVKDASAYCWGDRSFGALGLTEPDSCGNPRPCTAFARLVTTVFLAVTDISAGGGHSCAIRNGAAMCWGWDNEGQVGVASTETCLSGQPCVVAPTTVPGMASGVTAISAGGQHTCAIKDGAAWCWGDNARGQLGNNSIVDSTAPVQVSGLTSGVTSITAGAFHSCAVKDGAALCWGENGSGELGNNDASDASTPQDVSGLGAGVAEIHTGGSHTCARAGEGVKCWGANIAGQLGEGTTNPSPVPVDVTGMTAGVSNIAAGGRQACAIHGDSLSCWGQNTAGQLGDNGPVEFAHPLPSIVVRGVVAISAGAQHACALQDGAVLCWGPNNAGQLGGGTADAASNVPVPVQGLSGPASAIAAGGSFTCALLDDGVWCWGYNFWGQLGNGTSGGSSALPVKVSGLSVGVPAIAAGGDHACAVDDGLAWCWGGDYQGQLGNGPGQTQSDVPVLASGLAPVSAVSAGDAHTCAIRSVGFTVSCWGYSSNGQVGNNSLVKSESPVSVIDISGPRQVVAAGGLHSCAAASTIVQCWGKNDSGQLGNGTNTQRQTAGFVSTLTAGISDITAGSEHACALVNTGAYCWGENANGQLGDTTTDDRNAPVPVLALADVNAIDAGGNFTCALSSGIPYCWGYGIFGSLGDGTNTLTNTAPLFVSWDSDRDGCTDQEEDGANESFGGDRDRFEYWDFYDVTGDRKIDLSDTLLILEHFGHGPDDDALDNVFDRYAPDDTMPFRTAESPDALGVDLTDALVNLASFGHDCSELP